MSDLPVHIGFILDGNRRWAKENNLTVLKGHRKGFETLKKISRAVFDKDIKYMTVYAFSSDNWNRSTTEVNYLMKLFLNVVENELDEIIDRNVRLLFIGSREKLSTRLVGAIDNAENKSASNTAGTMVVCINYGGTQEIVDAAKKLAESGLAINDYSVEELNKHMYHPEIPQLDLIIRSSGEMRLSNFMLWRSIYAELYFTDVMWPDFSKDDLELALSEYTRRNRRFGK